MAGFPWQTVILGLSAASQAYGTYLSSKQVDQDIGIAEERSKYDEALHAYQQQINEQNAKFLDHDINVARRRGVKLIEDIDDKVDKIISSQRASFAGRGISVESGSVQEYLLDTEKMGDIDKQIVLENTQNDIFAIQIRKWNLMAGNTLAGYQQQATSDIESKLRSSAYSQNKINSIGGYLQAGLLGLKAFS